MQLTIENVNYKFIPSKVKSFDAIIKNNKTMENDIYEKYEAIAEVSGELIICNDITKMKRTEKKIIRETYEEYLKSLKKRDPNKDKWIYNIIDGTSEQEKILYRDDSCIIIPTYMWDSVSIDKLHILCLPTDISLRSIRSLTAEHISLLEHMKKVTLETIKNKYGIDECYLKIFFHYEPSTYHLHIHFVNTAHYDARSSVEYSHELNNVIFNLSIYSQYYKVALLNRRN
jgi:diadenosine tetraphosphate (Ap4A) HIT family hydrolase